MPSAPLSRRRFLRLSAACGLSLAAGVALPLEGCAADERDALADAGALGAMSWDELVEAGQRLAACASADDSRAAAREAGLVADDGTLADGWKVVELSDGEKLPMQLAGIRQDSGEDGAACGMSFLAARIADKHTMNDEASNAGGWEQSALRAWMNGDLIDRFPNDLAQRIVPARKRTNNAGRAADATSVTVTTDRLWVPSWTEIWGAAAGPYDDAAANAVLAAEGVQYELFAQAGLDADASRDAHDELVRAWRTQTTEKPADWWTRTPRPSDDVYFAGTYASGAGDPEGFLGNYKAGVVVGFCL